ncbi:ArsC/Spx/MgsR family protein [Hasllibacter sp. MH4015]|uniref:ArsC/Spx/MgsR family protein n=1 Tax=Hasllibacter sp. MH4015 TaxID=2854029 RepID=UPI001CD4E296|nr:ArsC/Spx/MgsR family protein [Hasllibacter sp. MH4015]
MRVYGLKNCDTCRAAAKALEAELVDIRAEPLDAADVARFEAAFGEALVNPCSTTWRNLAEADRAGSVAEVIAAHPTVMKRPVIEAGDGTLHLGWSGEVRAAFGV